MAQLSSATSLPLSSVPRLCQPLSVAPAAARGGFLVAVEDLERNDGSAEKPYFMSPDLKKLLKKKNKGQPEA